MAYNLPWDWDEVGNHTLTRPVTFLLRVLIFSLYSVIPTISSLRSGSRRTSKKNSSRTPAAFVRARSLLRPPALPPNSKSTTETRTKCTWYERRAPVDGYVFSLNRATLICPVCNFKLRVYVSFDRDQSINFYLKYRSFFFCFCVTPLSVTRHRHPAFKFVVALFH